jgi:hypothetical protein
MFKAEAFCCNSDEQFKFMQLEKNPYIEEEASERVFTADSKRCSIWTNATRPVTTKRMRKPETNRSV